MSVRLIVCGGRDYADKDRIDRILTLVKTVRGISLLIEGGCRRYDRKKALKLQSADYLAHLWAVRNNIETVTVEADWLTLGKAAGPIRNKRMLDEFSPDAVVAFPTWWGKPPQMSAGTGNMVDQARAACVKVWVIGP